MYGISPGGAMDRLSYRLANRLVGNEGHEPVLELTLLGPTLELTCAAWIAVCGADMRPQVNGTALPMNRPVHVPAGATLVFGAAVTGTRAYLAVAGGFDVPKTLGGFGAYPAARLDGLAGRALLVGDKLSLSAVPNGIQAQALAQAAAQGTASPTRWSIRPLFPLPAAGSRTAILIRAMAGPEFDRLSDRSKRDLLESPFVIRSQSDRMGYRLKGPALALSEAEEMVSEAVTYGTIQLPPSGDPIILMADRQTTGGYPRLLQVIDADLPLLAQASPNMTIQFQLVTLDDAVRWMKQQRHELEQLERFITLKLRER